jgi:hypothetical protein
MWEEGGRGMWEEGGRGMWEEGSKGRKVYIPALSPNAVIGSTMKNRVTLRSSGVPLNSAQTWNSIPSATTKSSCWLLTVRTRGSKCLNGTGSMAWNRIYFKIYRGGVLRLLLTTSTPTQQIQGNSFVVKIIGNTSV